MKGNAGIFILYLALVVMLCGCRTRPKVTEAAPRNFPATDAGTRTQAAEPKPSLPGHQIVFVSLVILQDSSRASRVIRVEQMLKKPGLLKSGKSMTFTPGPHLKGTLLSGPQPLDTFLLEHPLFKNQEYVNEQQQLAWKALSLHQASFFIRFQQKGASHLKLEERLPGSPPKELINIKL